MESFVEARDLEVAQSAAANKKRQDTSGINTQPEQNAMQSTDGTITPFDATSQQKRDQGDAVVVEKRQAPAVQDAAQSLDGTIQAFNPQSQAQARKRSQGPSPILPYGYMANLHSFLQGQSAALSVTPSSSP
jgi:hypothetical protein